MTSNPSHHRAPGADTEILCPLCAGDLPTAASPAITDHRGRQVQFHLCPRCQVLAPAEIEPAPAEVNVEPSDSTRQLADGMAADAPALAWELAEHLPPPPASKPIIDLGMGRGALAAALQSLGYTVTGCEPSAFLCQMARASYLLGPATLTNTDPLSFLSKLEADGSSASAVVLWHVVDRQTDPIDLLRRCAELTPGGVLFVEFAVARADQIVAEERMHPTPATLLHLADELGLMIKAASVNAERSLRVVFGVPAEGVVDLDRRHTIDLPSLEAAYRAASQVFADLAPEPDRQDGLGQTDVADRERQRSSR